MSSFQPERLKESLRQGSRVVVAAQIGSQLVSLAVLAALYRLLGREPYGLLGMVVPLLLLVRIFISSGLNVATIQEAQLTAGQLSAVFWINQALGLAMAATTAICAPLLVWFYDMGGHDVGPLGWLTVALAGTSMAAALGVQHEALLQRKLRLGTVAVARLVALGIGGLAAIAAALAGWGVWALVVQQYVELLALAAIVWTLEPWRPGFALRGVGARHLVRFGGHCMLSALMFYLVANVDKIMVGFALGAVPLALYSQAFNLMMKPVNLVLTPLGAIMLPVLSRARGDRHEYAELVLGFFRFIGLVLLPAAVGLAIVAPEAIRLLGGPQWAAAGPVLRVLAVAILVQGFSGALASVFASAGRADRLAYASVAIALVLCGAFYCGLQLGLAAEDRWGPLRTERLPALLGVALSYSLAMVLVVFPPYLCFALRTAGVSVVRWLGEVRTAGSAALGMGLVVAGCHWLLGRLWQVPDPLLLAVEILLGVLCYALLAAGQVRWFIRQALG